MKVKKKLIVFFLFSSKKQGSKCEQNILLAHFCDSLCVFVLLIQTWVFLFVLPFPLWWVLCLMKFTKVSSSTNHLLVPKVIEN